MLPWDGDDSGVEPDIFGKEINFNYGIYKTLKQ